MKDDTRIKFMIQALRKRKVLIDGVYKKLGVDSNFDIHD
jgi:hypothetical protein